MSEDRYDAFISYSHARDRPAARAVQRTLHRLGRRWYRRAALRVFRDDTSLAAGPDLWAAIDRALRASRTFILLAAPESAASPWVGREVAFWRRERSNADFLIVLTDGDLTWDTTTGDFDWRRTTALPNEIKGWFDAEPLWVDLRGQRERLDRRLVRDRVATIAAAVHGVPKDQLLSEEARQQRRLVGVLSVLLVAALVAALVAVVQRNTAVAERDRADRQTRIASSRALAAESAVQTGSDPRLAAELAIAAYRASPTPESAGALLRQVDGSRHVVAYVRRGTDQPSTQRFASSRTPTEVALSPDGALLAYAHLGDRGVTLCKTAEHRRCAQLAAGEGFTPSYLEFSGDGRRLIADVGAAVQVWDTDTRAPLRTVPHPVDTDVVVSPDAEWIAWAGKKHAPGLHVQRLSADAGPAVHLPQVDPVYGLDFDIARHRLVVADEGGVSAINLDTGRRAALATAPNPQSRPALAAAAGRAAYARSDAVELWDLTTGRRTAEYPAGLGEHRRLILSTDGRTVVIGGANGRVTALDTGSGQVTELVAHRSEVVDLSVTANGSRVASVSVDGDVIVTAPAQDARLAARPVALENPPGKAADPARALSLDPRGRSLALALDGGAELRELPGGRQRQRWEEPSEAVALSADGARVAMLSQDWVTVLDARSGTRVASLPHQSSYIGVEGSDLLGFAPDGRGLLVDTPEGPTVFDPADGRRRQVLPVDQRRAGGGFDVNGDGTIVAVATAAIQVHDDGGGTTVEIWRWDGARYRKDHRVHVRALARDVAVNETGSSVAVVDIDGRVTIAAVDGSRRHSGRVADVSGHGSVAFTAGGTLLVQADCLLNGIVVWDVASGLPVTTWRHEDGSGSAECFSTALAANDAGLVVTAHPDASSLVWRVRPAAALDALCRIAGEPSAEVRSRYPATRAVGRMCR